MTEKQYDQLVGKTLEKLRTDKKWTLEELGQESFRSRQQIHEWETGAKAPNKYNLRQLLSVLGFTMSEFFKQVEEKEPKETTASGKTRQSKK